MKKTTVYLTDELADAIKSQAKVENCSEAEIIRSALEAKLETQLKKWIPTAGLLSDKYGSLNMDLSNLDQYMTGFGES